jgi:hypothetical protein
VPVDFLSLRPRVGMVPGTQDTYMARGREHTQVADLLDRTINDSASPILKNSL